MRSRSQSARSSALLVAALAVVLTAAASVTPGFAAGSAEPAQDPVAAPVGAVVASATVVTTAPELSAPVQPPVPAVAAGRGSAASAPGRAWWSQNSERGWLGIRLATKSDVDRAVAAERLADEWIAVPNLTWLSEKWDGGGALVLEVIAGSPAEKAGLWPGDVIQSFNGIRTQSPGVVVFVVQRAITGHDGDIEVMRDGEKRRVLVEIGMHPEDARRLEEAKAAARLEAERGDLKK